MSEFIVDLAKIRKNQANCNGSSIFNVDFVLPPHINRIRVFSFVFSKYLLAFFHFGFGNCYFAIITFFVLNETKFKNPAIFQDVFNPMPPGMLLTSFLLQHVFLLNPGSVLTLSACPSISKMIV